MRRLLLLPVPLLLLSTARADGPPAGSDLVEKLKEKKISRFFSRIEADTTLDLALKKDVLKRLKVHEIQVSIDGMSAAHDTLRGTGTWDVAMGAVHHALDAGFEVSVSTMVHPGNLGDFDAMERLFRSLGVKDWAVDVVI